ncbi:MAG: hypothetical protein HY454_02695 [Parcubacteria group bacterium]|nr:hypothetical protein [Parcubacteria group bacterium]
MDILKVGKFIEHYGWAVVWVLGLVMGAFAAATFYFYGLKPPGGGGSPQSENAALKENVLNDFTADLEQRQNRLAELKREPLQIRDIFR